MRFYPPTPTGYAMAVDSYIQSQGITIHYLDQTSIQWLRNGDKIKTPYETLSKDDGKVIFGYTNDHLPNTIIINDTSQSLITASILIHEYIHVKRHVNKLDSLNEQHHLIGEMEAGWGEFVWFTLIIDNIPDVWLIRYRETLDTLLTTIQKDIYQYKAKDPNIIDKIDILAVNQLVTDVYDAVFC